MTKDKDLSKMIKFNIIPAILGVIIMFLLNWLLPTINEGKYEFVEETTKDIVFDTKNGSPKIIIETNDSTIVKDASSVTFKRSEKEYDYVTYKENKEKRNVKTNYTAYLTDNDIKKYSKEYALIFKETLVIEED